MKLMDRIDQRIESYREDMIRLQLELTAIPALSPDNGGDGEQKKSEFLAQKLTQMGFKNLSFYNAGDPRVSSGIRPNIVATIPGKTRRAVWILTHLDVVPPGELGLWSADPYQGYEKDGKMYGRGTEDNQQDLVASLFAAKAFLDEGIEPEATVRLGFVSDEETGSEYGLIHLLTHNRELFGPSDIYVVPDSGNDDGSQIEVAEKSIFWVKFKTIGKQCHASRPGLGRNAFRAASSLVIRLDGLRKVFSATDPLFEPPESTFEPTRKDPNVANINTIPGEDVFYMDCRVLPGYRLEDVLAEMRRVADDIETTFGVTIEISPVQMGQAPAATQASAPVVLLLQGAINDVYGVDAHPIGIGGGTVAANLRKIDLPAAVWCRIGETAHQPDEHCLIANMIGNAKVYARLFATPE